MKILILLENAALETVSAIDERIAGICAEHGLATGIEVARSRAALIHLIENSGDIDALIVTPDGPDDAIPLDDVLSDLECFSVEVQPANIAARGRGHAGADAELFGMGVAGYATAVDLLRQRELR